MTSRLFFFDRRFQLWAYSVSHSRLLLRSTKAPGRPTRVDVLFKDVQHVNVATSLDALEVREVEDQNGSTRYFVGNEASPGWVVASAVSFQEDEREFHEPSPLFDGTEPSK